MSKPPISVKIKAPKGRKDTLDLLLGKLSAIKPKAKKDGTPAPAGSFEFARSTKTILSRVKYVLKTGIEPIDDVLGGGLAFGRIVEPYGLEGSGKSALAQLCVVQGQKREIYERVRQEDNTIVLEKVPDATDFFCVYIDNEQSVDDGEKLVINDITIDALIGRCDTVDQMFKIIDQTIDTLAEVTAEQTKKAREKDKKAPEHLAFILIVVDTIAGTSSKEEMAADWGDDDYNRQPKQLRTGFRRMVRKINRHNVCLICTNQVSEKFDKKRKQYGSTTPSDEDFSSFGGRALKFYASQRLFICKLNANYKLNKRAAFASGFSGQVMVAKNRLAPPMRTCRFVLLFAAKGGGFNNLYSKLETMVGLKYVEVTEKGAYKFRFSASGVETTTFDGEERGNPGFESRDEWPAFYQAHAEDIDKLWKLSAASVFADVALPDADEEEGIDDDDDDDDQPQSRRQVQSKVRGGLSAIALAAESAAEAGASAASLVVGDND